MRSVKKLILLGMLLAAGVGVRAAELNYNPLLPAPAPVLDLGWAYDTIYDSFVDSADSPYDYDLAGWAQFTMTDDFVVGDQYFVYDFGSLILTTAFTAGGQPYGGGVGGAAYQWGSVLLGPGLHSLTVQGDGVGGIPAGLWTRLDTAQPPPGVPDGGSLMLLSGLLWGGLGLGRLLRKRA